MSPLMRDRSGVVRGGEQMIFWKCAVGCATLTLTVAGSVLATAQEVTSYEYDSLGRLVRSSAAGGPNSGTKTGMCFDKAGNRVQYVVKVTLPPCATQSTILSSPDMSQAEAMQKSPPERMVNQADSGN